MLHRFPTKSLFNTIATNDLDGGLASRNIACAFHFTLQQEIYTKINDKEKHLHFVEYILFYELRLCYNGQLLVAKRKITKYTSVRCTEHVVKDNYKYTIILMCINF